MKAHRDQKHQAKQKLDELDKKNLNRLLEEKSRLQSDNTTIRKNGF